jgi:hypothetical protein
MHLHFLLHPLHLLLLERSQILIANSKIRKLKKKVYASFSAVPLANISLLALRQRAAQKEKDAKHEDIHPFISCAS